MAQYVVLIYGDEKVYADGGPDLNAEVMKGHMAFSEKHGEKIKGGQALQGLDTATSVRPDGPGFTVTDGPFVETKEALGGFYLFEAESLDEAIEMVKDIPTPGGGVEVRPVIVFD